MKHTREVRELGSPPDTWLRRRVNAPVNARVERRWEGCETVATISWEEAPYRLDARGRVRPGA